ncbi:response regulator [Streptomyces sp. NPDC000594]|uniref:response regulator n=1 Tax=Streptomyces sp. NPDC000594 TaxID=3154261 RepID=UPI003329403A
MPELRPLAGDLREPSRALAQALRELFTGLEVSVRRYAARRARDAGTFSRYLSGTRVPPWEVVMDLFTDLAEYRGTSATPEAIELIRGLHRAAVEAGTSPQHAVEVLEQQLADADRISRRSTVRGDVLGEALLDRQHQIADLEVRLSQLEAEWNAERERADRLAEASPDLTDLLCERDTLRGEVARLTADLEVTRHHRERAEERCRLLERQLESVERAQRAAGLPAVVPAPDPYSAPLPKVLIVDDQPDNLLAMTAVLAALDQELVAVSSGREALKALLDHDDFAVILMDVQMPQMDGYETAAHIKRRRRNRDVPIIFLTAMGDDPAHSARGYAAGAVDYIGKPFDPWVLRAKVAVFTGIHLERRCAAR